MHYVLLNMKILILVLAYILRTQEEMNEENSTPLLKS